MHRSSIAVSTVAVLALAAGSIGMAQASPHDHGRLGEDTSLARSQGSILSLTKLYGKVNDNRDMTLSDTTLAPGRYRIIIRDSTKRHNWHIFGNGVDKETSVRGTGAGRGRFGCGRGPTQWSATRMHRT